MAEKTGAAELLGAAEAAGALTTALTLRDFMPTKRSLRRDLLERSIGKELSIQVFKQSRRTRDTALWLVHTQIL